jgi:HD-GYP domain-containing protein (c-di-GMP phosphodiesterase class II)
MTAGLLHDIGKVTIPEHILNKESKFTDDEYETMKTHAIKGYSILSKIDDMMDIAKYIKYHHERWDGKGYPHQLIGEQIPLQSRIITIADAFDAMISKRCYKQALSEREAVEELIRGKGSQFDPMLTDLFIKKVLQCNHSSITEHIN